MPRVLLIGTGHVGTFAARALVEGGATVIAVDADPAPGFFWRFGPRRDAELVSLDAQDLDGIRSLLGTERCSAIVMCAGMVGAACVANPARARRINVDATAAIAGVARELGIRLIFVSSLAVYGHRQEPVTEASPLRPHSLYGQTKVEAESRLHAERAAGLDLRIVRPCGSYGPIRAGGGSQSARLIESVLLCAVRYGEVTLRGASTAGDQYVYVKDVAAAIACVTLRDVGSQRVFNVGPAARTTLVDLQAAVEVAVPGVRVHLDVTDSSPAGGGTHVEASLIRSVFGFEPRYSLVDGLADYVNEAEWRQ